MNPLKVKAKATNEVLATYLKRQRQYGNHTMRTLAEVMGTPHSFVGKIEKQSRRLDVGEFIEYTRALEKDPVQAFEELLQQLEQSERQSA